jgi:hypothetical protein
MSCFASRVYQYLHEMALGAFHGESMEVSRWEEAKGESMAS